MDTRLSKVCCSISFCCNGLFGAPAFAPIGTIGDTPLGAPHRIDIAGKAEIIIVGIPNPSTTL